MRRTFAVGSLLALLSGCTQSMEREQRQASHDALCRSFGHLSGTPQYAQCRQQLWSQDENRRTAVLGAMLQRQTAPSNCVSSVIAQTIITNCQ
jgi:hypothetical protein